MYLVSILNFPDCLPPPEPKPCEHEEVFEKYTLRWYRDECNRNLHFHVVAETTGYIAMGFSYAGNMYLGDVVIGGVDSNGDTYFGDYYTRGTVTPELDDSQDYTLTSAQENATHTELKFFRAYDTGDLNHDSPVTVRPTLIFNYPA